MTAILALPLITMTVKTSVDDDWIMRLPSAVDLSGIEFSLSAWLTLPSVNVILKSDLPDEIIGTADQFDLTIRKDKMRRIKLGTYPFRILAKADGAALTYIVGEILQLSHGGSSIATMTTQTRDAQLVAA